jgi:predicted dehydrogenase
VKSKGSAVTRAVVVGGGAMGRLHAGEYNAMDGVDLIGIVEPRAELHEALAREFGTAVEAVPDAFLGECDVVSVCAPDHLHVQATLPWLASGARVLLEKPLATSTKDGLQILAARRAVDDLMVGHILRFDPRVIRAREVVKSGQLGEVVQVEVWRATTVSVGAPAAERTSAAWFLGIHDADLVRFVTGLEAESVHATGRAVHSAHEDAVYAVITYCHGAIGTMTNYWSLPDARPNRAHAGLRVIGTAGSVEVELGHTDMVLVSGGRAVNPDTRFWPSVTHAGPTNLRSELVAFVQAAVAKAAAPVSGEDALAAVAVVEAIHESMRTGERRLVGAAG